MKKQLQLIFLLCFLPIGILWAQQKNISGKVTNEDGNPLEGVTISIKGHLNALSQTSSTGEYQVEANTGDVLVFASMGYANAERTVSEQGTINVILTADLTNLDEVVVVGYGTQKKVNLTGAVSTINSEQLERRPIVSTSSALQGLAPGVTVTSQSGAPGGDQGQIRIRGVNSFGGSDSEPLVIIDGVAGSLDNVDANLIENISILKDAASAAIYGSRAANGVILITTKRGKDQFALNYRGYTGWQDPTFIPKVTDGATFMKVFNDANMNDNGSVIYSEKDFEEFNKLYAENPDNFDWQKAILNGSGFTHNHFVSLNAGAGKIRVAPSLGYVSQDGLIDNTGFKRYTFRNNMDINPNEKLNIRFDLSAVNTNRLQIANEGTIWNYIGRMPTNIPIRVANGLWSEGWVKNNPVAFIEEGGNKKVNNLELLGNLSINYKPFDWLSISGMAAPRYRTRNIHEFAKAVMTHYEDGSEAGTALPSELTESAYRYFNGSYSFQTTAQKSFNDHNFSLMLGASRETYDEKYLMGYRRDFTYDTYEVLNAGADTETKNNAGNQFQWLLVSTFGRFNYDYKGRYLLEANLRYDGSSRFAKSNRWAAFPSFSAGWRISEEPFMADLKGSINQLKLRGSWGILGNQNIGTTYQPYIETLNLGSISVGGAVDQMIALNTMANSGLLWEETTMAGVGLDASLFNNFSVTFDWYTKQTDGILMKLYVSELYGKNAPFQNAAKVQNQGWEASVRYDNQFGDFKLGIGANISDVKNKILDMKGQVSGTLLRQQEGYSINSIYGYQSDGLYQSQEEIDNGPKQIGTLKPGDIRYKDIAGDFDANGNAIPDGKITDADKVIIGSTLPRYTYGFNLDLGYKGVRFSAFLQGVAKANGYLDSHYVIPAVNSSAIKPWQLDYWSEDNREASLPRVSVTSTNNTQNSDFWMRSASYLRLKNVQLGYEIPKSWLANSKIGGIFIYANGQNLFTKTNFYEGYDPEINYNAGAQDGVTLGSGNFYPQVKVYTFGLDFKF